MCTLNGENLFLFNKHALISTVAAAVYVMPPHLWLLLRHSPPATSSFVWRGCRTGVGHACHGSRGTGVPQGGH